MAGLDELPSLGGREFIAENQVVALFRDGEHVYALDGVCPHQGGPLGNGRLCGHTVTCPWHGWQFDVRSGQHVVSATIRQRSFPVRIDGGRILIQISS